MKGTVTRKTETIPAVIARLCGSNPTSFFHKTQISQWLHVEWYKPSQNADIEECGRLICLPVDDQSFGLQLAYALQDENGEWLVFVLHVHPDFLSQWSATFLQQEQAFRFDHSAEHELRLDGPVKKILSQFPVSNTAHDFNNTLLLLEQSLQLIRRAVTQLNVAFEPCIVPACRFLANDAEREKIHKAREILDTHYDQRMTIKALAKKVAMNECYLKKGFKTLTGKTIHEYIAGRRIASAKHMLQSEKKSVTEVAALLGFSSISHFSTAFKNATGLKPCELLG